MFDEKVLEIIGRVASDPTITKLDLSFLGLPTLPPEIGALVHLEELILKGNLLTDLPPEFAKLKNLKRVDLSCNEFTHFPLVLNELELESVDFYGNPGPPTFLK